MIETFQSTMPPEAIAALKRRIAKTKWPQFIGAGWQYGADESVFRELAEYWQEKFDWREHESRWNSLPQFLFTNGTDKIHFLHFRSKADPNALPILLTHGWPGSFLEFLKIALLLTDPESDGSDPGDAFHVITPSLPGFGFSGPTTKVGINTFATAELWVALMCELGYSSFVAQGGDIGASVTTILGWKYPESVPAIHLNYIPGSFSPHVSDAHPLSPDEARFLSEVDQWATERGAYSHLHRTQPELAGIALNDSPMGLAAWIIDKFRSWSDGDGDVERRFSKDDLLANVSLYWFTETITSSMRMYAENRKVPLRFAAGERIQVPCGIAHFLKESPFPPRPWVERIYNVQRWSEMDCGGHFAAWEEPHVFARELRTFFRPFRRTHGKN